MPLCKYPICQNLARRVMCLYRVQSGKYTIKVRALFSLWWKDKKKNIRNESPKQVTVNTLLLLPKPISLRFYKLLLYACGNYRIMNGNIVFTNAWCFVLVTSYVFSTTSVALLNYAGGTCSPFDMFFGHCIFIARRSGSDSGESSLCVNAQCLMCVYADAKRFVHSPARPCDYFQINLYIVFLWCVHLIAK